MTLLRSPIHSPMRSPIYSPLVGKWGGPYDASLFGPADDGFLHNLSQTSLLAQNSNGTTPVTADSGPIGWAKSTVASLRIATQATTSARPFWKTPNFARLDGADDNWLTTFNPSLAASLAVKLNANVIGKIIVGAESGTNGRSFIGINSSGKFSGGVGAQSFATIQGTTTITNTLGVGVMTYDGTTVKLYWNGALEYSAAQSGVPGSVSPYRVGAFNSAGTAANFYSGDLYNALAINRALTAAEVTNLTNYWMSQ